MSKLSALCTITVFLIISQCSANQDCRYPFYASDCISNADNLNLLDEMGVRYVYGVTHTCDVFLLSTSDKQQWSEIIFKGNLKRYLQECDVSGLEVSFIGDNSVEALQVTHIGTGAYEKIEFKSTPVVSSISSLSSRAMLLGTTAAANGGRFYGNETSTVINENTIGHVCRHSKDDSRDPYSVHIQLSTKNNNKQVCLSKLTNIVMPISMGFVMNNTILYDRLAKSAFVRFFERLYYNSYFYWMISISLAVIAVPLVILCGRSYKLMLIAAVKNSVALDGLISSNCDDPEHILRRQDLLMESGYENISFKEVCLNDADMRTKINLLGKINSKSSQPVDEPNKSIKTDSTQNESIQQNSNQNKDEKVKSAE